MGQPSDDLVALRGRGLGDFELLREALDLGCLLVRVHLGSLEPALHLQSLHVSVFAQIPLCPLLDHHLSDIRILVQSFRDGLRHLALPIEVDAVVQLRRFFKVCALLRGCHLAPRVVQLEAHRGELGVFRSHEVRLMLNLHLQVLQVLAKRPDLLYAAERRSFSNT